MAVSLITWGRFPKQNPDGSWKKVTVPAPNTDPGKLYLWDYLCQEMPQIAQHFDALQLPNQSKCLGGNGDGCDGYGVYDLRDLGSKPQQGSTPTRYGTKQSYLNVFSVARAWGLRLFLDLVLHQQMGENEGPGKFRYKGAYGEMNGRGATAPGWFRGGTGNNDPIPPFSRQDDVPNKFFDYPFGRERNYQNVTPHRATTDDALDYGDWLFRLTDADGARFDDVKGTWAPFVREFMTSRAMASKEFHSEYFEGDPNTLQWWTTTWPMQGRSGVADFTTHWALRDACNNGTARPLARGGFNNWYPDLSYLFVDNPDTDTSDGQQISSNKLLAYAYVLSVACKQVMVYGKDYFPGSVWPGSYGLKPFIDNLTWIHRKLAYGDQKVLFSDDKVLVLQRNGQGGDTGNSAGLVTALNFDEFSNRKVTVPTCFWPGTQAHDFAGHHGEVTVDGQGNLTMDLPKNAYRKGQSYCCFSWVGMDGGTITLNSRTTTQRIYGDETIDTKEAEEPGIVVGSILCRGKSSLGLHLLSGDGVEFAVADQEDKVVIARGKWSGIIPTDGQYTIKAYAPTRTKFKVDVTYSGVKQWSKQAA